MRSNRFLLALTLALATTGLTLAGPAELTSSAETLLADYTALETEVAGCPGGDCPEAPVLLDERDVLEAERLDLEAERETLGAECSDCGELDVLLDDLAGVARSVAEGTGLWEDAD